MKKLILFCAFVFLINLAGALTLQEGHEAPMPSTGGASSDRVGQVIEALTNLEVVNFTKHPSSDATKCYINDGEQNAPVVANGSFAGNDCVLNMSFRFNKGQNFSISVDTPGGTHSWRFNSTFLAVTKQHIKWTDRGWTTSAAFTSIVEASVNVTTRAIQSVSVTLNSPADMTFTVAPSLVFNATLVPSNITLVNSTLFIWFENNTLFNQTTVSVTGNVNNESIVNVSNFATVANYRWNFFACARNETPGFDCKFASTNRTFTWGVFAIDSNFTKSVFETDTQHFNVTFNVSSGTPTAVLNYNGSRLSGTGVQTGNKWVFSRSLQIPANAPTNKNLFWELSVNGLNMNTTVQTQQTNATNLTFCGSGITPIGFPYLNFTYKNETPDQQKVNAFVPSSTLVYWLGDGTVNKTLSFVNSTELSFHQFCFLPQYRTANVYVYYSYDNGESEQRLYNPGIQTYTNTTTQKVLFLLPTSQGIYVTFQVISLGLQPLSGATVTLERAGVGTIAQETTGASGTATIFLNPNFQYTLTVQKEGFSTFAATQSFPTTEYTVTLGLSSVIGQDLSKGISLDIWPKVEVLRNNTNYNFNYTLNSSFWSLDSFGFVLKNSTGTTIASNSSGSSGGGFLAVNLSTGNNTLITMDYFWVINGTYTNHSVSWAVRPAGDGSFLGFFQRLRAYMSNGIFGINAFGIALLLFFTVFIFGGVLSYKFGLSAPIAILGSVTLLVILFSMFNIFPIAFGVEFLLAAILIVLLVVLVIRDL